MKGLLNKLKNLIFPQVVEEKLPDPVEEIVVPTDLLVVSEPVEIVVEEPLIKEKKPRKKTTRKKKKE